MNACFTNQHKNLRRRRKKKFGRQAVVLVGKITVEVNKNISVF